MSCRDAAEEEFLQSAKQPGGCGESDVCLCVHVCRRVVLGLLPVGKVHVFLSEGEEGALEAPMFLWRNLDIYIYVYIKKYIYLAAGLGQISMSIQVISKVCIQLQL